MLAKNCRLVTSEGEELPLPDEIKEIYLLCVVSDHYPALSFQVRQFLKTENIDRVQAPLVMDIFTLDVMTEMLQSPLQFLSYVNRRAHYAEQLIASQELTILGYHLTRNLWVQPDIDVMHLYDDFTVSLDITMMVRRIGLNGAATPDGILTRFEKTTIGRVIKAIESRPDPAIIDLGFFFLAMSEQAVIQMSRAVNRLAALARNDGKIHDATFPFEDGSGITFHCTDDPAETAAVRLQSYCIDRKYKERATRWFGLCLNPSGPDVRFGVSLAYPWVQNSSLDQKTKDMRQPVTIHQAFQELSTRRNRSRKIGRNDPCPCGSGRKYKRCCIN